MTNRPYHIPRSPFEATAIIIRCTGSIITLNNTIFDLEEQIESSLSRGQPVRSVRPLFEEIIRHQSNIIEYGRRVRSCRPYATTPGAEHRVQDFLHQWTGVEQMFRRVRMIMERFEQDEDENGLSASEDANESAVKQQDHDSIEVVRVAPGIVQNEVVAPREGILACVLRALSRLNPWRSS